MWHAKECRFVEQIDTHLRWCTQPNERLFLHVWIEFCPWWRTNSPGTQQVCFQPNYTQWTEWWMHPTLANQNNRCHLIAQCANYNGQKFESQRTGIQKEMQQTCAGAQLLPFFSNNSETAHWSSFAPSVLCPSPATFVNMEQLHVSQQQVTGAFSSMMNCNHNMPQAVIFATKEFDSLGLHDFAIEWGIAQVSQMLKHTHTAMNLGSLLKVTVNWHQLTAGVSWHCMQDTRPLPHAEGLWINSIQAFPHEIKGETVFENVWTILTIHENDQHLMEAFIDGKLFSDTETWWLNCCQMFLQVVTLGDILDHMGKQIMSAASGGETDNDGTPVLWQTVHSTLEWPTQQKPNQSSWNLWECALWQVFAGSLNSNMLKQKLGMWHWDWMDHHCAWINVHSPQTGYLHQKCNNTNAHRTFAWSVQKHGFVYFHADSTQMTGQLPATHLPITMTKQQNIQSLTVAQPMSAIGEATDAPDPPPVSCNVEHWLKHHKETGEPTPIVNLSFMCCLATIPEQWDCDLVQSMCTQQPIHDPLIDLIQNGNKKIYIVSDATMQGTHDSVHCWMIATDTVQLWASRDAVPGPANPAHTGQSKGFGTLSTLQFTCHHCMHHNLIDKSLINPLHCLHFCDNKGMTTGITDLVDMPIPALTLSMCDNFDLCVQIHDTVQELEDLCSF